MASSLTKSLFILSGAGLLTLVFCVVDQSPVLAQGIIRSEAECTKRIHKPRKARRCIACVRAGGEFYRDKGNPGHCKMPNVEPPIRSVAGCRAKIHKRGKVRACVSCIRRGGVFYRNRGNRGICAK